MHPHVAIFMRNRSKRNRGFTMMEVMIAIGILAVGYMAALGTIANNSIYQKSLDENDLANLVLSEMSAKLNATSLSSLGMVYTTPTGQVQGWPLHMRATASANVAAATTSATLVAPYNPPYPPLGVTDLINAGIINAPVALSQLAVYVEYYNLNTQVGLTNVGGSLVPVFDGLIRHYDELQDGSSGATAQSLWYSLVGDPNINHYANATALSPTDSLASALIMPATFSTANTNLPGTPQQVIDANNHGVVIRIVISWLPAGLNTTATSSLQWRETILVKSN